MWHHRGRASSRRFPAAVIVLGLTVGILLFSNPADASTFYRAAGHPHVQISTERGMSWHVMLDHLILFMQCHGHRPRRSQSFLGTPLGRWVMTQRNVWRAGKLDPGRAELLDGIGMEWSPAERDWEAMFQHLEQSVMQHGRGILSGSLTAFSFIDRRLRRWIDVQRYQMGKGILLPSRVKKLSTIGLDFRRRECDWEQKFNSLAVYRQAFGSCDVPYPLKGRRNTERGLAKGKKPRRARLPTSLMPHDSVGGRGEELGYWVCRQRSLRRRGALRVDREQRLSCLGVTWDCFNNT